MLRASAGSIKLTSVYGNPPHQGSDIAGSPAAEPYSHLLEIDGVRILLDCGWDEAFSVSYLEKLRVYAPTVDAVLISTPELCSCGALPYVLDHLKPGAFIAAPASTSKMGIHGLLHPFLYQYPNTHEFTVAVSSEAGGEPGAPERFTLDVDKIYSAFRSVREPYGRDVIVTHRDVSVKCSTIFTGRMLGCYGWQIKYQIDELFYCPDYSLKPSFTLKRFNPPSSANMVCLGCHPFQSRPVLAGAVSGPAAPASSRSGGGGAAAAAARFEDQLQQLFKDVQHTLRGGSDVLFPTNVPGRGLEILSTMVHVLQEKGGDRYKVILASLQAQELMDKAATMTEALQDEIMLGDRALFTNVVACRTAADVLMVAGPKICIADGASLDFGIAAELLPHFLSPNSTQGGDNLIVFTEAPAKGTNAYEIAQTPQSETITYTFAKRSRLDKEELEEYYMQQEREVEAARLRLLEEGTFGIERDAAGGSESDDEEDLLGEERVGAGGASHEDPAASAQRPGAGPSASHGKGPAAGEGSAGAGGNTPGLVLPPYLHFSSRFLCFPVLETTSTLAAAAANRVDVAYGLPVSDEEQLVMRKIAPNRSHGAEDEGPEALRLRNDAQMEANIPSKVTQQTHTQERSCKVVYSDLSGYPDAPAVRNMLKTKFTFAKKLVAIRGGVDCWRPLAQFCRMEKTLKCGDSVFMLRGPDIPLELATQVMSYVVQLDPELARRLPSTLKRVRETNAQGSWDVGWVSGELRGVHTTDPQQLARVEESGSSLLTLSAVHGSKLQQCAEEREAAGLQRGSFFVGKMELVKLRDATRRQGGLHSEFQRKAPMLVFDDGVCVRRGATGTITVASMASPSMYEVRQSVYKQFSQAL